MFSVRKASFRGKKTLLGKSGRKIGGGGCREEYDAQFAFRP